MTADDDEEEDLGNDLLASDACNTGSAVLSSDSISTTAISHVVRDGVRRNSAEIRLRPTKHHDPVECMSGLRRSRISTLGWTRPTVTQRTQQHCCRSHDALG